MGTITPSSAKVHKKLETSKLFEIFIKNMCQVSKIKLHLSLEK